MSDNSEPAFPSENGQYFGMSLRDYFAAMAMQGTLAAQARCSAEKRAESAYELADAMLAERAK